MVKNKVGGKKHKKRKRKNKTKKRKKKGRHALRRLSARWHSPFFFGCGPLDQLLGLLSLLLLRPATVPVKS